MPTPDNETTVRRAHDRIPGEATLASLLPQGWTLLSLIALGIGYSVYAWTGIQSNAEDLKAIKKGEAVIEKSVIGIQQTQAVMKREFELYRDEQRRRDEEEADRDQNMQDTLQQILLNQGGRGGD